MEIYRMTLRTLEEGIQTILYCALSTELDGVTGKYYRNCKEGTPLPTVHNRKWQTVMWNESKRIVKLTKDDPEI
jgi:hypothetical protein